MGIFLIVSGTIGYLMESLIHTFAPSLVWLSTIGVLIAINVEITLAIVLVITAIRMTPDLSDTRTTVIKILTALGEATTAEIMDEASKVSPGCKDRVPRTLTALENDKVVSKRISKEKKGYVWTLVS